jgi:ATP-binding cassette, subfamily F, member 3
MRIGIAKLLLQDPNIVLLDEPTNHLDLDSVSWLEKFLVKQNIPLVVVSHDREFLDKVCQLAV